jgi:hypothetical protein
MAIYGKSKRICLEESGSSSQMDGKALHQNDALEKL